MAIISKIIKKKFREKAFMLLARLWALRLFNIFLFFITGVIIGNLSHFTLTIETMTIVGSILLYNTKSLFELIEKEHENKNNLINFILEDIKHENKIADDAKRDT